MFVSAQGITWSVSKSETTLKTAAMMNEGHKSDSALMPAALTAVISWSAATRP